VNCSSNKKAKFALAAAFLYAILCIAGGILLAELQLHPPRRGITHHAEVARAIREYHGASLEDAAIPAKDGVVLKGWFARPGNDNGSAIILLHGVSDNREGVAGYARAFLKQGYRVLLPDARAHGESGGAIATYGIKESDDIHRWVDWLERGNPKCVYGFGESMGSALLLQSLNGETRFCAVVTESPFSRFEPVAYERAASYIGMPAWFGRTALRPVVDFALFYTRVRYGIDFRKANPADAVASTKTPMLLIGDVDDINILPHHAEDLARLNPRAELWMVEGASHCGAVSVNQDAFEHRVTGFLGQHNDPGAIRRLRRFEDPAIPRMRRHHAVPFAASHLVVLFCQNLHTIVRGPNSG
jgi:pimeloyl-ACP methyl ester carboxylesterase